MRRTIELRGQRWTPSANYLVCFIRDYWAGLLDIGLLLMFEFSLTEQSVGEMRPPMEMALLALLCAGGFLAGSAAGEHVVTNKLNWK